MEISGIIKQTELTWGKKPETPKDFEELKESIEEATKQSISVSSLKRMWGYVQSDHTPREDVLDILATYCGYKNWKAFEDASNGDTEAAADSNMIMGECINGEDISKGKCITVMWNPRSKCVFKSLGNGHFIVKESKGSKLQAGTTFTCSQFIQGEPLYLTDICTNDGVKASAYVCGREQGCKIIEI